MKLINQAEFALLTLSSAYISLRIDGEMMSTKKSHFGRLEFLFVIE